MARRRRVGFSRQHLELNEIGRHHRDIEASVRSYFDFKNVRSAARFAGYTSEEIRQEMNSLLEEQDRTISMNLLASLEAAFRVDFLQRCYKRRRDPVSREFRKLHALRERYVSLEDDIFSDMETRVISTFECDFGFERGLQVSSLAGTW